MGAGPALAYSWSAARTPAQGSDLQGPAITDAEVNGLGDAACGRTLREVASRRPMDALLA